MSTHSQRKGQRAETELADKLCSMGFQCRRTSAMYQWGADAPDVSGIDGIHIEVKRCERLNLSKAMKQSIRDAQVHETPVVCHRRNREPWMVTVRLDDLENLLDAITGERPVIDY
mgnify:CR=1 FL=1